MCARTGLPLSWRCLGERRAGGIWSVRCPDCETPPTKEPTIPDLLKHRVRLFWGDALVTDARCSSVMAHQIVLHFVEQFAGMDHQDWLHHHARPSLQPLLDDVNVQITANLAWGEALARIDPINP